MHLEFQQQQHRVSETSVCSVWFHFISMTAYSVPCSVFAFLDMMVVQEGRKEIPKNPLNAYAVPRRQQVSLRSSVPHIGRAMPKAALRHLSPEPPGRAKSAPAPRLVPKPTPTHDGNSFSRRTRASIPLIEVEALASDGATEDLKARVVDIDKIKAEICRLQEVRGEPCQLPGFS